MLLICSLTFFKRTFLLLIEIYKLLSILFLMMDSTYNFAISNNLIFTNNRKCIRKNNVLNSKLVS